MKPMKYIEFIEWQKLIEKFRQTLSDAQKLRPQKQKWVTDSELEWMIYERNVMFQLTNQEREKRGLNPVSIVDIKRCENSASGHVDYTSKFGLYCAELAVGEM